MKPNVICTTIFGSRLYGTNTPESDYDYKGIYLPTAEQILDQEVPGTWSEKTNKSDSGRKSGPEDSETELFSLGKFLDLLAQAQTVALDVFYAPLLTRETSGIGGDVLRGMRFNKDKLISKNVKAGISYARAQAHKYSLKGDRIKALEFMLFSLNDLKEAGHVRVIDCYQFLNYRIGHTPLALRDHIKEIVTDGVITHYEVCGRQFGMHDSLATAHEKLNSYCQTYGKRAHQAKDDKADLKAWYHAVRITEQLKELLTTGNITFPRPEVKFLMEIRNGEHNQEYIGKWMDDNLEAVYEAQRNSKLPDQPDTKWIREFVRDVYRDIVVGET